MATKDASVSVYAPQAAMGAANATPDEHGDRDREQPERRVHGAESRDRCQIDGCSHRHAAGDECLVPEQNVPDAKRRREHRVVLAAPLDRGEDGPARLERRDLHRGGREEPRCDELEVRDAVGQVGRVVDERPEPEPEREQEDHRRDDARDRRPAPYAPVLGEVELERASGECERGHSIRLRPVRCRKTSSSVLRRTRTLSGTSPRSCSPCAAASPLSV